MKRYKKWVIVLILGLGIIGGEPFIEDMTFGQTAKPPPKKPPAEKKPAEQPASSQDASTEFQKFSKMFTEVGKTLAPSVVNLNVKMPRTQGDRPSGWLPMPEEGAGGVGTGVIVDKEGFILTNNHVVAGAKTITVVLEDKREFPGKIVGRDPDADVAVVQIIESVEGLKPAILGDSNKLEVGEWVIAIGNPFGMGHTLTVGVVSALREMEKDEDPLMNLESYVQTDAAINPGNSGGPLINLRGEVIGINSMILTGGGGGRGSVGVGFAIPINRAKAIMKILIEEGRITRPFLGVSWSEINQSLARYYNYPDLQAFLTALKLKDSKGVFILNSAKGSPAEKAGLAEGDVIIEFGGEKIEKTKQIQRVMGKSKRDTPIEVKIMRNGLEQTIMVTLNWK